VPGPAYPAGDVLIPWPGLSALVAVSDGVGAGLDGGAVVGSTVGDGDCDGDCDGLDEGLGDPGVPDGDAEGEVDAVGDGDAEGDSVGLADGDAVGVTQPLGVAPGYCDREVGSRLGPGLTGAWATGDAVETSGVVTYCAELRVGEAVGCGVQPGVVTAPGAPPPCAVVVA
jgi:hypothetical protein